MAVSYKDNDGTWKDINTLAKNVDREKIDDQLGILETEGYYGSLLIKSQDGKLIYYKREETEPLSGANRKK